MKHASPCLCHASWAEHSQSEKQDENRMELGHDDESIASKISKAYFRWSVKAISYHVSKCNPRAISSHVTPSAALSYRTVKLRCLGTLLCLVLSNFRAPKSYNKHGEIARNTVLGVTGGANSSIRTDRTPPNEKKTKNYFLTLMQFAHAHN